MIAKTQENKIRINNVGAIELCEVPLEPGQVTHVTGRNGAGKSTVIRSVLAACGGPTDGLEPRDGEDAGTIDGPGIALRIGKRVSKKGQCETFVAMESGEELQRFIDPGVKDPVAADNRRIEAMLNMAGIQIDLSDVREMIGADDCKQFEAECSPQKMKAVELVAVLRRWLHKKAQAAEVDKTRLEGEISAIPAVDSSMVPQDVEHFRKLSETAKNELLKAEVAQREASKAAQELQVLSTGLEIEKIRAEHVSVAGRIKSLSVQIDEQRAALEASQSAMKSMMDQEHQVSRSLKAAEDQQRRIDELTVKLSGQVTEQHIAELQEQSRIAIEHHEQAVVHNQKVKDQVQNATRRTEAEQKLQAASERAKKLRELAAQAVGLLGKAVDQVEGFKVQQVDDEMRLCCIHRRGQIPFAELSPGEQAVRAIQVSTGMRKKPVGKVGVVAIPQHVWESLDDDNRSVVQAFATEQEIAILVAEASHGSTSRELSVSVSP